MFRFVIAYVDPGIGATALQLVLAGTVGIGALVKLRWQSIKQAFGKGDEPIVTSDESAELTR